MIYGVAVCFKQKNFQTIRFFLVKIYKILFLTYDFQADSRFLLGEFPIISDFSTHHARKLTYE